MCDRVFLDKAVIPDETSLRENLKASWPYLEELRRHIAENYVPIREEWKYYGKKYGWTLKVLQKKRNLLFMAPLEGCFAISFVFGDRAVAAIEKSDLPENIIDEIRNARRYVEGRGFRVVVKSREEVNIIPKLLEIKVNN